MQLCFERWYFEYPARKAIEKAADEATVDDSQEPAQWGNSKGLTVLENQDIKIKSLQDAKENHTNQIASLKGITESYLAVRSRFFAVFIRDKVGKTSRADQKSISEGDFAAHGGDPLTDAIMFKKKDT